MVSTFVDSWLTALTRTVFPHRGALANARAAVERDRRAAAQRAEAAEAATLAARRDAPRARSAGG